MLGLFHDAGIAVLAQKFDNYKEVLKIGNGNEQRSLSDVEYEFFKTNHTAVGYYLVKSWHLPLTVSDVVLERHNIEGLIDCGNDNHRRNQLICILKMASNISNNYCRLAEDYEWDHIESQEFEDLREDIYDPLRNQ